MLNSTMIAAIPKPYFNAIANGRNIHRINVINPTRAATQTNRNKRIATPINITFIALLTPHFLIFSTR